MSMTLGERLRQAREARGITISEVAEQTRISGLYLEAIENDDYRSLPGGIFNKGFVKSYARYVGIDEKEALADYVQLLADQGQVEEDRPTTRPEVLTDDRSSSLSFLTVVSAILIVGLLVGAVLGIRYYFNRGNQPMTDPVNLNTNTNAAANTTPFVNTNTAPQTLTGDLKVEFKAVNSQVWLSAFTDGIKSSTLVNAGSSISFAPKSNLKLAYAKNLAPNAELTLNGKRIELPTAPANARASVINIEITKENAPQIFQSGTITLAAAPPASAPAPRR